MPAVGADAAPVGRAEAASAALHSIPVPDQWAPRARQGLFGMTLFAADWRTCIHTAKGVRTVDMRLEIVVLPVCDVDRAKAFYRLAGFNEDVDFASGHDFRVVQFTPPSSGTSIVFGKGIIATPPGSVQGLQLVVTDIEAARAALMSRGIDVGEVFHDIGGVFYHLSPAYEIPGADPDRRDYRSFARFSDPDGNSWVLQEARTLPGR